MEKDTRLVNIYLKIHHKKALTMEDLAYLAKYAPECFEKTCKNVVYNFPEAKVVMETAEDSGIAWTAAQTAEQTATRTVTWAAAQADRAECGQDSIEKVLEHLKRLEMKDFPVNNIDMDKLKNLLGNLYMEMLFPHNDKDTFFSMAKEEGKSFFDAKI